MPYWDRLFSTGYKGPDGNLTITTAQESGIVSILSAGTFFGALSSPFMTDYIGRRPGLMIATWVFNLGVALQVAATAIPLFMAGRFFAGFGVGQISAISKYSLRTRLIQDEWDDLVANTLLSSPLPVRDSPQVDSRCHCRIIPMGHYNRSLTRSYCQQRNR